MKLFILIYLFSFNVFANSNCESSGAKLYGDIKFKEKKVFNEFPKKWNVNSDMFDDLYIKVSKDLKVNSYELKAVSLSKKEYIYQKKQDLGEIKNSYYKLNGSNFSEGVIPDLRLLPMKLTLKLLDKNNKTVCTSTYSLEVIQ
jgi:hypothetical protein